MARVDGIDPDQPLAGYRRIVGETIPVFRYDLALSAWALLRTARAHVHCGVKGAQRVIRGATARPAVRANTHNNRIVRR
jgi:hypothetical protein